MRKLARERGHKNVSCHKVSSPQHQEGRNLHGAQEDAGIYYGGKKTQFYFFFFFKLGLPNGVLTGGTEKPLPTAAILSPAATDTIAASACSRVAIRPHQSVLARLQLPYFAEERGRKITSALLM